MLLGHDGVRTRMSDLGFRDVAVSVRVGGCCDAVP